MLRLNRGEPRLASPRRAACEQTHCLAVAVQSAHVDIVLSCPHAYGFSALPEPCIDQCADVGLALTPGMPESVQLVKDMPGHLESAPYPLRVRVRRLDLDFLHTPVIPGHDGIEELRPR